MAITSKLIKVEEVTTIAQDYNPKIDKKVDKLEGHGLYPDVDKTKLSGIEAGAQKNNITSVKVNNQDQTISDDGTLNLDIESVIGTEFVKPDDLNTQLEDYAKTETVDGQLAQKLDVADVKDKVKEVYGDVATWGGSVADYSTLTSEKSEAENGTIFNVTETGENYIKTAEGFDKFDVKVDLTPYLKSTDADGKFATQTELEKKADQSAIDSLTSSVEGKLAESDLTFATTAEVKAALKAGETPAV